MEVLQKHISHASQLFTLSRYSDAIAEAKKALKIDPTNGAALGIMVNAYAFGEKPGLSVQLGLDALSHHPEDDYLYFGLGVAAMRMGHFAQAEEYFKTAIKFQQWQPAYHANLAIALKERGHWEAAEMAINKALELHPDYDFAHNVKAQIFQKLNPQQAEKSMDEAIRLSPENDYHHRTKGRHAFAEKDYVQAAFHYQQVIRLDPTNASIRHEFLRTLVRTHPQYCKLVQYYPYADDNMWRQVGVLLLMVLVVLSLKMLLGTGILLYIIGLPIVMLAAAYWLGEPFARSQLFTKYFKQRSYTLANVDLPLQSLMQLCVIALFFVLFTDVLIFKILVISSLLTALFYIFSNQNHTGDLYLLQQENPWLMTGVWCGIALLVPILFLFGGEEITTEGMS